jgi:flagellin
MSINTNPMAMQTRHKLATSNLEMSKTLEKLSSGLRINRAADDAAGLAVSEKLRSQIRGTGQAMRNAQDGISMIQTAEGALEEVHDMLQRMRELSVQSANDTYSVDDRKAINNELQALKTEINAVSTRTKFNGKALLTGAMSTGLASGTEVKTGVSFAAGDATNGSVVSFNKVDVSGAKAGTNYTVSVNGSNLSITDGTNTQEIAISANLTGAATGATASQDFDFNNLGIKLTVAVTATGSAGAADATDLGTAITANADVIATDAASASANFQIGAGSGGVAAGDAIRVNFDKVDISSSGMSALDTALTNFNTKVNANTFVTADAEGLTSALDSAIGSVNDRRGALGATQNRLEHTVKSLAVGMENLSASESRIRDTDVATETSNMVRAQILTQAGTSILAQANQVPQGALGLLR